MGKLLRNFKLLNTPKVILFFMLLPIFGYSAPIPATSSSSLLAPDRGLFYIAQGFQLSNPDYLVSVKLDEVKNITKLEDYAKKWMKDYSNYGFDLLGSRSFKENEVRGIVVDLFHKKTQTQLRQSIFLKDQKAVILTCKEEKTKFPALLENCNKVIKSFYWR